MSTPERHGSQEAHAARPVGLEGHTAGSASSGQGPTTSQRRSFHGAVLANLAGSGVSVVIGLVTSTILARMLGPAARGEYAAILNWPTVMMSAGLLGAPTATVFFVAKEPQAARAWQAHALLVAAVGTVFAGVACWLLMPALLSAQSNAVVEGARRYCVAFGVANALWLVGVSRLQGQHRFDRFNVLRVAQVSLWLITLVGCWASGVRSPAVIALLFATSFLVLAPFGLLARPSGDRHALSADRVLRVLRYGIPAVASTLPQLLSRRLDQLMLASFARPEILGLYAVAATLAVPVGIITAPVANVLMPSLAAEGAVADRGRVLATTMRASMLVFGALVLVMLAAAPVAILVLFGTRFAGAIQPVLVLVPAAAVVGLTQILEDALLGLDRPMAVIRAELAGLVAGGLVLAATLAWWPLVGAAASSLAGATASFVLALRSVTRELELDVRRVIVPTRADVDRVASIVLGWFRRSSKA